MTAPRMYSDIERSGISRKDARKMRVKALNAKETASLGHIAAPSYKIPYFDLDGRQNEYYRVRYLNMPKGTFGAQIKKPKRYCGPAGVTPKPYFAPVIDWIKIKDDTSVPIILTEGEKKGFAGCLAGAHCIALGGVTMFQSKKKMIFFLPELHEFNWSGRTVYIAFDSDKESNVEVLRAMNSLADVLIRQNAKVHICDIPESGDGNKQGLDDYLAEFDPEERADAITFLQKELSYE